MRILQCLIVFVVLGGNVPAAHGEAAKPLNGIFASFQPAHGGEILDLKNGRFTRERFSDVLQRDTGTGLEHNPQTGSYLFDGYRLVLLGDMPLVTAVCYLVNTDGVDLLLDQDTARQFLTYGKVQTGQISLRVPSRETRDIATEWRKVAREHPRIGNTFELFARLRAFQTKP